MYTVVGYRLPVVGVSVLTGLNPITGLDLIFHGLCVCNYIFFDMSGLIYS